MVSSSDDEVSELKSYESNHSEIDGSDNDLEVMEIMGYADNQQPNAAIIDSTGNFEENLEIQPEHMNDASLEEDFDEFDIVEIDLKKTDLRQKTQEENNVMKEVTLINTESKAKVIPG